MLSPGTFINYSDSSRESSFCPSFRDRYTLQANIRQRLRNGTFVEFKLVAGCCSIGIDSINVIGQWFNRVRADWVTGHAILSMFVI
jgi:hypothetical protein